MLATETLLHRLAGVSFVVVSWVDDPEFEGGRDRYFAESLSLGEALGRVRASCMRWGRDTDGASDARLATFNHGVRMWIDFVREAAASKDPARVVASHLDDGECPMRVMTRKAFEEWEAAKSRKQVEADAAVIAARHRVEPGTVDFFAAVHSEISSAERAREDWNDGERRMEEWAACRHAGVGSEVYFDDLNFENGRIDSRADAARRVLEWSRKNTPLLYASYREKAAREERA